MNLKSWPYVQFNGEWSIPDQILSVIWKRLDENGKIEKLFYEGGMRTPEDFIRFFQNPDKFLVLGVDADSKQVIALGFLSSLDSGKAYAHFSFVDGYKPNVGEMIIDFWKQMVDSDGNKIFDVLIGITPETYETVLKIIQKWGFKVIGRIPRICNMYYKNEKEGGIISYYLMKN